MVERKNDVRTTALESNYANTIIDFKLKTDYEVPYLMSRVTLKKFTNAYLIEFV